MNMLLYIPIAYYGETQAVAKRVRPTIWEFAVRTTPGQTTLGIGRYNNVWPLMASRYGSNDKPRTGGVKRG